MTGNDLNVLRDLAKQYMAICSKPVQEDRRALWRDHNSLIKTRPPIFVYAFAFHEMPEASCMCEDPFFRRWEYHFRYMLFWDSLDDDTIFEPWVNVDAVKACTGWGVECPRHSSDSEGGSYKIDYPLKSLDELDKLRMPRHGIDEVRTAETVDRLTDAIGDIIPINVVRAPAYRMWAGDLATDLGSLRGIEHFMMDMLDNPEGLHRLVRFLSKGVLATHEQAEAAGDWGLTSHQNQALPYCRELPDPAANVNHIPRKQLWGFMAAQELTGVSPDMHDEFLLQYQLPILKEFGLVAYGCCEDLSRKIELLRQIPNLRRIAVSPMADVAKCAEQIQQDYVFGYRPSPAEMVSFGFDEDRIRSILRRDLGLARDCHVEITLKNVITVEHDPQRIRKWVQLTREIVEEVGNRAEWR